MRLRKRLWIVLLLIVCLEAGCAGNEVNEKTKSNNVDSNGDAAEVVMGRYMETEYEGMEFLDSPEDFVKKTDGSFIIYNPYIGIFQSTDEGRTWEALEQSWYKEEMEQNNVIFNAAFSETGCAAYITSVSSKEKESDLDMNLAYYYVDTAGNKTVLDLPYSPNDDYVKELFFAPDGSLYGTMFSGKIYEINIKDGSAKVIYEAPEIVWDMVFVENKILLCGNKDIYIYNREREEPEEKDEVLSEFIKKEIGVSRYTHDTKKLLITSSQEDNVIYFAFDKGLYRHVLGGSAIEQLIDGSLCTLSDMTTGLVGLSELPDNRFLILYTNKLILYTFDNTVPAAPSKQMRAYSLTENKLLKQAIKNYQTINSEVYVDYIIGMNESSGITREDAIKKLNTEIMAGNGPDFLLIDGLPIDSYIEKGILTDISPYFEQMEADGILLENVVEAYKKDDKIYTLPVEINTMIMAGDKDIIAGITDFKTFADAMEELRRSYPEGSLIGCYTEELVLKLLAMDAMPAIVKEDGSIDTEKLTEFLTQAKRIYEAEAAGVTEEDVHKYELQLEAADADTINDLINIRGKSFTLVSGEIRFAIGPLNAFQDDFDLVVSVEDAIDNYGFSVYTGMQKNVFTPGTMVGISSKAENPELAGELLQVLFSEDTLKMNVQNSFTIHKSILQQQISEIIHNKRERYGNMGIADKEGNLHLVEMRAPTEEELNEIMDLLEQANVPNAGYDVIESALYEIGPSALNATMSIEEAVSEINKKVAIYLVE